MSDEPDPNIADTPPEEIPVPPGRSPWEVKEVEVEIGRPVGEPRPGNAPRSSSTVQKGMSMIWPSEFLESSISSFISTDVPTVKLDDSAADAAKKLNSTYGVVFITDANNKLKGIITKGDLIKYPALSPTAKANELGNMDKVVAISSGAQLWQLLKIMNGENKVLKPVDILPVVDIDKKPVGVIRRETLRERLPQKIGAYQR